MEVINNEDLKHVDIDTFDDEIKTIFSQTNSIVASKVADIENIDTDKKSRLQQRIELSILYLGKLFYDSSKCKYEIDLLLKIFLN